MNTAKYLDGFLRCATDAANGGHPETCLVATLNRDYAAGWHDALESIALFRCMQREIFNQYIEDFARYSLALRSEAVHACERCGGKGWLELACSDDNEQVDCVCVQMALEDITQELGH